MSFIREQGGAAEIHVRVACPPIVAPCFYGIDMSSVGELFAPKHMAGMIPTVAEQFDMATELGADSLLYLPLDALARCIGLPEDKLCRACVTGQYPTESGQERYQLEAGQARPAGTRPRGRLAVFAAGGGAELARQAHPVQRVGFALVTPPP